MKAIDTFRKETASKSNLSHTCPRYQVKTEDCLCLYSGEDCQGYNLSFQSVCIVCTMCTTLGLTSACNYANRVSGVNEYSLHAWITWPGVGCPTFPLVCVLPYYTWILYWNWIIRCVYVNYPSAFFSVSEQRKHLIQTMTDSVCQEYDAASNNLGCSPDSFQKMKLLSPHMEYLLKVLYTLTHSLLLWPT